VPQFLPHSIGELWGLFFGSLLLHAASQTPRHRQGTWEYPCLPDFATGFSTSFTGTACFCYHRHASRIDRRVMKASPASYLCFAPTVSGLPWAMPGFPPALPLRPSLSWVTNSSRPHSGGGRMQQAQSGLQGHGPQHATARRSREILLSVHRGFVSLPACEPGFSRMQQKSSLKIGDQHCRVLELHATMLGWGRRQPDKSRNAT
jgi:hypothetical protein